MELMTFTVMNGESKETAKTRYYNMLLESKEVSMTKLIDRCHNVSNMAGTFSKEKLVPYIDETREYVLSLLRRAKLQYPEYSDALCAIKYHMVSVVDAVDAAIQAYESEGTVK